jgi:hypothetical protein
LQLRCNACITQAGLVKNASDIAGALNVKLEVTPAQQLNVELSDALRIKSAEFWLKLGEVEQALLEIKSLPESLHNHPWIIRIQLAIVRATSQAKEYKRVLTYAD